MDMKKRIYLLIGMSLIIIGVVFGTYWYHQKEITGFSETKEESADSIFGVGYAVEEYANLVSEMGAKWTRIPMICWGKVEPEPPQNGNHFYNWDRLDEIVREYEDAGLQLQMIIKASCPWGSKGFVGGYYKLMLSYPPKDEYWDDYYQFVYNLVERYDGDGYKDMPGLRYPIRYHEVESEAMYPIMWAGTVEEYGRLLKTAYNAAKEAHPETKIILSGINFGDVFDGVLSQEEFEQRAESLSKRYKNLTLFVQETLAMGDYYDIVDYHYNRDYTGVYGGIKWIREELAKHGYQKDIWAGDVASMPWVTDEKHKDILAILTNPSHPRHQEAMREYRAEQAKLSVKKFIVAAELGIKKVILEPIRDFPLGYEHSFKESWFLGGFFNDDKTPRPVVYAYAQLTEKLDNFQKIERLPEKEIYVYKVYFSDRKPMYIAWCEKGPQKISLNVDCSYVKLEKVIISETKRPITKTMKVENNQITITINNTPIYIECFKE